MNMQNTESVVVLGASHKPERYAYKAQQMLLQHGHRVTGVSPRPLELDGIDVVSDLADVPDPVDTLTVYVNPLRLEPLVPKIVTMAPRRVILNPGTESDSAVEALRASGIEVEEACTLVLLSTGQF